MSENLNSDTPAAPDPDVLHQWKSVVRDASRLLAHAVATGIDVDEKIVQTIYTAESWLERDTLPEAEFRTGFAIAYRTLAKIMAPISAETLKATSDADGRICRALFAWRPTSKGRLWSRKLWVVTFGFLFLAFLSDHLGVVVNGPYFPVDQSTGSSLFGFGLRFWQMLADGLGVLEPFTYGGIGACAYLLRTCHGFVHRREFDTNRIPEYYNRIFLGVISGGLIFLFIDPQQAAVEISAAALAFLAGYNSDFLFSAVERISQAILPKIGSPGRKGGQNTPADVEPVSLDSLLRQYGDATTDDEKRVLEGLIEKLKSRL